MFNNSKKRAEDVPNRYLTKQTALKMLLASGLLASGMTVLGQVTPGYAQRLAQRNVEDELINEVVEAPPEVLAAIREAPFSEVFDLNIPTGEPGYAIKDKDFNPRYDGVGLYTLWGDVPERDILQLSVFYCFRNRALANAELENITLLDGEQELVTIDQKLVTTQAEEVETTPAYYETTTFFSDPFYSPYWGGGYHRRSSPFPARTVQSTYVPAENCSVGGGRFDLASVRGKIAQLPNKTLTVKLLFSNGRVENWRLGGGTVERMKAFPSLQ
ncbi:MAG: hypothetical protein AAFN40_26025 [Cyanobacteria bacterium J06560_6]